MEGQLTEHPTAELIREIADAKVSGALRLTRERAQAVVYFEKGALTFAASNLRTHRLSTFLRQNGIFNEEQFAKLPDTASDAELVVAIEQHRLLDATSLEKVREYQVTNVVRAILLWTNGEWKFEQHVRLTNNPRVQVDVNRLLLECARHLPEAFVASRFNGTDAVFARKKSGAEHLAPAEASLLSRAEETGGALSKLVETGGLNRDKTLQTIYGLWLGGALQRKEWPRALVPPRAVQKPAGATPTKKSEKVAAEKTSAAEEISPQELETFFSRLENTTDHYEVLNVGRLASANEIKDAYHAVARRFHPDRFHRSDPELRNRIDSAFARIAQAYETLSDETLRDAYDQKRAAKSAPGAPEKSERKSSKQQEKSDASRAEVGFQTGMSLLKQNRREEATRFLAEAATLQPKRAAYRAHYGHALTGQRNTRRIAEVELQAAISLEPGNSSYRVMLAELYKTLGLRQRAEGELRRALALDPKNEAALTMLANLKK
jgi:curved DNA-binding protein CbpA